MSIDEANKYFVNDAARACSAAQHAKRNGVYVNEADGNSIWVLRSPGMTSYETVLVDHNGYVAVDGRSNNYDVYELRPAIWIEL